MVGGIVNALRRRRRRNWNMGGGKRGEKMGCKG